MQYRLKSKTSFPPGGWRFRQKETRWALPPGLTFNQAVQKIIEHRRANALDAKFKAHVIEEKVAQELEESTIVRIGFNSSFVYAVEGEKKTSALGTIPVVGPILDSLKNRGALLVNKLRNSVSGLRVMTEWFGDGGVPVEQEKAEARAAVCETCPNNSMDGGNFTKPVAAKIKEHLQVKNKLEMKVPNESKLGICSACSCALQLKIWTPIEFITENTAPVVADKFTPQCWIRSESDQTQTA